MSPDKARKVSGSPDEWMDYAESDSDVNEAIRAAEQTVEWAKKAIEESKEGNR